MNEVNKLVGELVEFLDGRLVNHCALMNLHTWSVALEKFSDFVDEFTLQLCILEGLKFIVPLSKAAANRSLRLCS